MTGRIQWRRYKQSDLYFKDLDAVVLLHSQTEQALGQAMQLPDLSKPPVVTAWVAERDGVVVGGFYLEAVLEPVFFGRDPVVSASARRLARKIVPGLAKGGFRMARIEVPRWIGKDADTICEELEKAGFVETDSDFRHMRYDLTTHVAKGA